MGGDDSQKLRPWRGTYSSPGRSKPPALEINTLSQRSTAPAGLFNAELGGPSHAYGVRMMGVVRLPVRLMPLLLLLPLCSTAQTIADQCRSVVTDERFTGGFDMGHIDNPFSEPIVRREFSGIVVGEHDGEPRDSSLVQIRGKGTKGLIKKVRTKASGAFRIPALPPGKYFFVAVAPGFQSVSGCLVIDRHTTDRSALIFRLPLGI
jgi:hypothetical protein